MIEPTREQDARADRLARSFDAVEACPPTPDGRMVLYGLRATPTGAMRAKYREVIDADGRRLKEEDR